MIAVDSTDSWTTTFAPWTRYRRIMHRRGHKIAVVAIARTLLLRAA